MDLKRFYTWWSYVFVTTGAVKPSACAARSNKNSGGRQMAVNVHGGGEVAKILMYVAVFAAFVVVALTWVPEWISPDSANITGNTGSTARMIQ